MHRFLIIFAAVILSACASTQKMHFASVSPVDYNISASHNTLDISDKVSLGSVSGGDYTKVGEFSNYSWHGFINSGYEGFRELPYSDPSSKVKEWISELLESNGLLSTAESNRSLDVFVQRLKLKTQKDFMYDYRACLIELKVSVRNQGTVVSETVVEGLAKLQGSDLNIIKSQFFSVQVEFSPDDPPVCKLAIANALRGNNRK